MADDQIHQSLTRLVSSSLFAGSEKLSDFLRFIVTETLAGNSSRIKESLIGSEVYGRRPDYDPKTDAIVRVEAVRLRAKLKQYYDGPGRTESVRIDLPKGTYVPVFSTVGQPGSSTEPVEKSTGFPQKWLRVAVLTVLFSMAFLAAWIYQAGHRGPAHFTLAVLPFVDLSGDPGADHFGRAVSEQLTHSLSNEPGFLVASRTAAAQFKSQPVDILLVGRQLRVSALVEGSVQRKSDRLRLTVKLVSASDGYQLWSEDYEAPAANAGTFQDQVSELITRTLRANFAGLSGNLRALRTSRDPDAARLYAIGHKEWLTLHREGVLKAISCYQEAIALDAKYAEAYAGLGEAKLFLAGLEKNTNLISDAKKTLRTALALDDRTAPAHAALGNILLFHDWDFGTAEHELRKALELRPGVSAHSRWYAIAACLRGHHSEAQQELEFANIVTADSEVITAELGRIGLELGHIEEAEKWARQSLSLSEHYPPGHFLMGLILERKQNYKDAISEYRICAAASPGWGLGCEAAVAHARIASGDRSARSIPPDLKRQTSVALLALAAGDREGAQAALERAVQAREEDFLLVKNDFRFEPLRQDPRFRALLGRIGL